MSSTTYVQFATTDNAFFKRLEVPLPLTHEALLDVARKKFKSVTKQSRLYDGASGEEITAGAVDVELATGAKVMVSAKAGWKGAERLRDLFAVEASPAAADAAHADFPAADGAPSSVDDEPSRLGAGAGPHTVRLQLVSFAYDQGQPHDTAANINARGLPNPGKAAMGRTGLEKRLAKEVLASHGAAELCERVVQARWRQAWLDPLPVAATADALAVLLLPRRLRLLHSTPASCLA